MTSINFPNTPSQGDTHEHLGITWICTHIAPVPRWAKTGDQAFNNLHLGAFATEPTLDNNGNALIAGQTFFNTATSEVGFYGTIWEYPAVETASDLTATNADVVLTNADVVSAEQSYQNALAIYGDTAAVAAAVAAAALSESNASDSEVSAGISAASAAADLVLTNADVVTTNADVLLTNADVVTTNADVLLTNADVLSIEGSEAATAADVLLTNADVVSTNADAATTAQDAIDTAADVVSTNADVVSTNADVVTTNADADAAAASEANAAASEANAATSVSAASTSETNAATSETNASTSETNAATSETNAATSETNAASSASAAASSASAASTSASESATSASESASSALAALASENQAGTYANAAAASANYQGDWSAGTYTLGESVSYTDGYFYAVNVASTTGEPTVSSDWTAIPAFESLPAIDSIVNTNTVVASFIYDTSNDSDNGAWATQSRHTSWYNETLNTATRGATRDFPRVALIVVEADTVTIYDAAQSTPVMWRVFENGLTTSGFGVFRNIINIDITTVKAKNGIIAFGLNIGNSNINTGLHYFDFINDIAGKHNANAADAYTGTVSPLIAYVDTDITANTSLAKLSHNDVNALAIAQDANGDNIVYVGSAGGLDRIYKGSVSSWTDNGGANYIVYAAGIMGDYVVFSADNGASQRFVMAQSIHNELVDTNNNVSEYTGRYHATEEVWVAGRTPIYYENANSTTQDLAKNAIATNRSLTQILPNPSSWGNGLINTTTDTSISGYQYGDIKGAFLGSNVAETLSGTELVTNGTFDTDTSGWTPTSNATFSVDTARLKITAGATLRGGASQALTTIVGKTYIVSVDYISHTDSENGDVRVGTTLEGLDIARVQPTIGTTVTLAFVAVGVVTYVSAVNHSSTTVGQFSLYDNISVKQATPDHSYNNNALSVAGSVDFAPVATGSELMAVSGFSASDYLYLPNYGADVWDNSGMYWMGWVKFPNGVSTDYLYDNTTTVGGGRSLAAINSSEQLYFYIIGNGGTAANNVVVGTIPSNWTFFCIVSDFASNHKGYINGELKVTDTTTLTTPTVSEGELILGIKNDKVTGPLNTGALSLFRIGAGAPTAAMIKKMYDDEKHLFQEGAQWSLPALDVKAVDYDESNGLLTAGTASGYVRKSGLINVDSGTGDASVISTESGILSQGNN